MTQPFSDLRREKQPSRVLPRFYDDVADPGERLALLRGERRGSSSMQIWAELTAEIEAEMARFALTNGIHSLVEEG